MKCAGYRGELIEMARGAAAPPGLAAHLAACADCHERLDMQIALTASMARAVSESSRAVMPRGAENALLAEFVRVRKPRVRIMPRWVAVAGVAAAIVVAAVLLNSGASKTRSVQPQLSAPIAAPVAEAVAVTRDPASQPLVAAVRHIPHRAATPAPEPEQPFIEVPYTVPLEPFERAQMMQVELPVSALIAAGMPVGVADPAARARADVIVGQDGRARAFRVISVAAFNMDRSF